MKRSKLMIAVALSCMLCASAVPTTASAAKTGATISRGTNSSTSRGTIKGHTTSKSKAKANVPIKKSFKNSVGVSGTKGKSFSRGTVKGHTTSKSVSKKAKRK